MTKSNIQKVSATLAGIAPLLMANGQLADPFHPAAKRIKELRAKGKKKTEADFAEIEELGFFASVYTENGAEDGRIIVPALNVENMLICAAKKRRMGPATKAGLLVEKDARLIYDGPKTARGLWEAGSHKFRFRCMIPGSSGRTPFVYPIFRIWSLEVVVTYFTDMLNRDNVIDFLEIAGNQIGLGAWRPRHGRFDVQVHK